MEDAILWSLDALNAGLRYLTIFLLILLPFWAFSWILAFVIGAPPFPSTKQTLKEMCDEIEKHGQEITSIVDIGSGYGHMVFHLAGRFPNKKIIGYEISAIPYAVSVFWKRLFGYDNVSLHKADGFKAIEVGETPADCAIVYLNPELGVRTNDIFDRITTLTIANKFPIPGREGQEDKKIEIDDWVATTVYFYKNKPARSASA